MRPGRYSQGFFIARGRFMAGAADEDGTRNAKDDAAYDEEEIDPESLEAATSALDELIIDPAFSEARDKELERMMPRHLIGSLMNSVTSLMQLYHIDPDFGEDVSGPLWRSDPEPEPPPNDKWSRGVLNVAPPELPCCACRVLERRRRHCPHCPRAQLRGPLPAGAGAAPKSRPTRARAAFCSRRLCTLVRSRSGP